MRLLSSLAMLLFLAAALPAQATERQWVTPDFFIDTVDPQKFLWDLEAEAPGAREADCRSQIAKSICVQNDRFERSGQRMSRGCAPDSERYVTFFERVYDRFPPALQKMFCSVRRISVEPGMASIAYAGLQGRGAVVGFRKSVIDEELDLSTLLSWKEQLPFGGERDGYRLNAHLPHLTIGSSAPPVEDLAFYVLAHEFGHLFDFANDLNGGCFPGANCQAEPGSWTALSWVTTLTPNNASDFPRRRSVCYYNCYEAMLDGRDVEPVYAELAKTPFVTLYASTNVYDDLAESLAFYLLDAAGGFVFDLDTRQGSRYDMLSKVRTEQFASKYRYIENFLHRDTIQYP